MGKFDEKRIIVGNDQAHLKEKSYKTAEKLNVRILTHQKYTEPKIDFYNWVLGQLEWDGTETVVDVGCGSGLYADKAAKLSTHYYACDLSHGMLLDGAANGHQCVNLDAMTLPLPDDSADVILANHMIYHIPDQKKGVAEFRRVLKPSGKMTAVTNADSSMNELKKLRTAAMRRIQPDAVSIERNMVSTNFKLETGDQVLKTAFATVEKRVLESWLVFPDPQPVIDYIASSRDWWEQVFGDQMSWDQYEAALNEILVEHFESNATFRVNKRSGVFICS